MSSTNSSNKNDNSISSFNMIEKLIFENLPKSKNTPTLLLKEKTSLDETHLKKLNSIASNLPFELIKQSYDKTHHHSSVSYLNLKRRALSNTKRTAKSAQRHKSARAKSAKTTKKEETPDKEFDSDPEVVCGKANANRAQKNASSVSSGSSGSSANNQIVIHVCDEAKRLKQDFTCPRDLLVREMKYFSYNLNINVSNSSQNTSGAHAHVSSLSALSKKSLDEIDISVHCDINIFDWLMRYVKRNHPLMIEKNIATPENFQTDTLNNKITYHKDGSIKSIEPKLDLNNCVSILLSSDFLLMENLVDKCIIFIAENLDSVLNIPCVMSGINEALLTKLAACTYVSKLDEVYDKKDKLKTKIFQRKIEFLFDLAKYEAQFEGSPVLNDWKMNKLTCSFII